MKKLTEIFFLFLILTLILVNTNAALAVTLPGGTVPSGEVRDKVTAAVENNFDAIKTASLKLIDTAVAKLNQAEEKVSGNTNIDATTKQNALNSLNKVEDGLLRYKAQLEKATTAEEVQAINQQVIKYLKDNKDVIKQNIQTVIESTAAKVLAKAEELKKQLELILNTLRLTCPSEKETIATLENQLKQLNSEIASLKSSLAAKNTTAIKQDIKDITALSQQIIPNVQKIGQNCLDL